MAENHDLLTCPLCQGHGELRREELIERRRNDELQTKIDGCLEESQPETTAELATVATHEAGQRDFQKDVHTWNPQLPMWRRSPKE
jgi:hypothetical protein